MPPSLREWLPEDHLAWFVIEAVEEMDLRSSTPSTAPMATAAPRTKHSIVVALLLYAYATSAPRERLSVTAARTSPIGLPGSPRPQPGRTGVHGICGASRAHRF